MRLSIPTKIFAAFLSVLIVTTIMAISVWIGLLGMKKAARDAGDLKDFQTSLSRLENFNWGPASRSHVDRNKRFDESFKILVERTSALKSLLSDLPREITDSLPLLDEQTAYFRKAYEELLEMQSSDENLHQLQHRLTEEMAVHLGNPVNDELRQAFSRILFYWGRAYHDRDIESINALHRLLEATRKREVSPEIRVLLDSSLMALDKNYLNYLALVEKEEFLAGTTKRYVQVSNQALDAIVNYERTRQSRLTLLVAGAMILSVIITLVFWVIATRYVASFLDNSKKVANSIRQGGGEQADIPHQDDEFGDLLDFMSEIGTTLNQSMTIIRASEGKYRTLVEELADWVWETDAEGRCVYTGPVGSRLVDLPDSEILGRKMTEILCSGDECKEKPNCSSLLVEGCAAVGVLSFATRKDGSIAALESSWKPIVGANGQATGLRGISRDVTERLALESERSAMREQLMHAQKMEAIGTLSGGVAHDFNNLLQTIGGYSDLLLQRGDLTDRDRATVAQIAQTTVNASRITGQLLLFGRRAETLMEPLDVNVEITRVRSMMERIIPKEIELKTELAEDLPPIFADRVQVEQVLMNLIINARDALENAGRITIATGEGRRTFYEEGQYRSGRNVIVSVIDNGKGIPGEIRQKIFDPFFTTKEPGKGTGLGLSIVYGIAKAHGAQLTCESVLGEGTTFEIAFPAMEGVNIKKSAKAACPPEKATPARPLTILIVDDERSILESCSEILKLEGYGTLTATSGEEALEIYGSRPIQSIDIVVLDISMPGMGGAECFKRLREMDPGQTIILASGYSDADTLNTKNRKQADAFLRKPYRFKTLLETIRTLSN